MQKNLVMKHKLQKQETRELPNYHHPRGHLSSSSSSSGSISLLLSLRHPSGPAIRRRNCTDHVQFPPLHSTVIFFGYVAVASMHPHTCRRHQGMTIRIRSSRRESDEGIKKKWRQWIIIVAPHSVTCTDAFSGATPPATLAGGISARRFAMEAAAANRGRK